MKIKFLALASALFAGMTSEPYSEITGIKSAYYAAAAYCSDTILKSWTCGSACQMNKDITNV